MSESNILFNRLKNSRFFANLATLSIGTVIAQIIPFVATIILSRLYNPQEMGIWGVFSSYASIFAIIGALRYDGAIVRAKTKMDAYYLAYLAIILSLLFTAVLYLFSIIVDYLNIEIGITSWGLYLLPIYTLTMLLVQSLSNLATYLRKYRLIATNSINRSLSQSIARIILGISSFTKLGMIVGAIAGNAISLITLKRCLTFDMIKIKKDYKALFQLFKANQDFPKYDLPGNLLNTVSSNCPPILLAFFFSDSIVGLFSMALNLLFVPMSFIGSSVSQLYYKDASECFNQDKPISSMTRKLFLALFYLGALFMCLIICCEDWIFGTLLGSRWNDVGKYAVLLSPWLLLVTSVTPLSPIFSIKSKLNINMNLNLLGLFFRVASIVIVASLFHSSNLTIFAFGLSSTIFFLLQGYYVLILGEMFFLKKDLLCIGCITIVFLLLYLWKIVSFFES